MNSKRILIIFLVAVISIGVTDILDLPYIFSTDGNELLEASAAKKKSRKKSAKSSGKKKKRTSKSRKKKRRRSTSYARKAPAVPPAETPSNDSLTLAVNSRLIKLIPESHNPGGLRVNKVTADTVAHKAVLSLNENFTYLPINLEYINSLEKQASMSMPDSLSGYAIELKVKGKPLSYYINTIDKLPREYRANIPFVRKAAPLSEISEGMMGDIVALWHSHGRYYKPSLDNWYWQRPLLFQAIEDTYTLSYILPYVVPMLENAGAYVMLPRERDINPYEVIVDNDGSSPEDQTGPLYSQTTYVEKDGRHKWEKGEGEGFIYDLETFRDTENPFESGSYRQVRTVTGKGESTASWAADFPATREYAVYVSYKSLPNSAEDAEYTVNYQGGSEKVLVNQKMGGGTWIYLGTYPFEEGLDTLRPAVVLSNHSSKGGETVVTADAVKIGGGMGNIARSPRRSDVSANNVLTPDEMNSDSSQTSEEEDEEDDEDASDGDVDAEITDNSESEYKQVNTIAQGDKAKEPIFKISGLPRWAEGARYWMQWAGAPDYVYSPFGGSDDYKDDYTGRGHWVNWLAGGSRVLPGEKGLGIPVDVTMALHSDAGKRSDDSIVGTLGIYYTAGNSNYEDGTPRRNSRTLTDMLMRQITGDIRQKYEPNWTRRQMWDKSYLEARVPEVPTSLIELMSHQNFGDMQYGNDPRFRFTVGRSIYKALARFVSERKDRKLVIQPLPVSDFAIQKTGRNTYHLSWQPTPDDVEPTAMPDGYIVMERSGDDMSFHKVAETSKTYFDIKADDKDIHSFRIIAYNAGGRSFPSETLAFRYSGSDQQPVLVINGFTRLSAPAVVKDGANYAGFDTEKDFGVPYVNDIAFTGYQTEFHRSSGDSFGKSAGNYITSVIAGNTFDFPYVHGEAIMNAGRGFVSASLGAVIKGHINLANYKTVDLILGNQKTSIMGKGHNGAEFEVFPKKLRSALTAFLGKGGRLLVSGQYLASDLKNPAGDREGAEWGRKILGVEAVDSVAYSVSGRLDGLPSPMDSKLQKRRYGYSHTLNEQQYIVNRPDEIRASDEMNGSAPFLTFSDTDGVAGLLLKEGKSRRAVMTVPFESFNDPNQRNLLMKELLDWLQK